MPSGWSGLGDRPGGAAAGTGSPGPLCSGTSVWLEAGGEPLGPGGKCTERGEGCGVPSCNFTEPSGGAVDPLDVATAWDCVLLKTNARNIAWNTSTRFGLWIRTVLSAHRMALPNQGLCNECTKALSTACLGALGTSRPKRAAYLCSCARSGGKGLLRSATVAPGNLRWSAFELLTDDYRALAKH